MNLKQTKILFFLLALILVLVIRQLEAAPKQVFCSTAPIDRVPGCYDALRLASGHDFRWLSENCCRAVFSIYPDNCSLTVYPNIDLPIYVFKDICHRIK